MEMSQEVFEQHFFDVRTHKPKKGQVMAGCLRSAEIIDGEDKRFLISMLMRDGQAPMAAKFMRKMFLACDKDATQVPMEILKDLLSGMTVDQVAAKPYSYTMEQFFYAKKEDVPADDPHWFVVSLVNLEDFLAAENKVDQGNITVKVVGDWHEDN